MHAQKYLRRGGPHVDAPLHGPKPAARPPGRGVNRHQRRELDGQALHHGGASVVQHRIEWKGKGRGGQRRRRVSEKEKEEEEEDDETRRNARRCDARHLANSMRDKTAR